MRMGRQCFLYILFLFSHSLVLGDNIDCSSNQFNSEGELGNALEFGKQLIINTNSEIPNELKEMATRLKNIKDCPSNIWPNYKLSETPIRLIEPSRNSVFKFNSGTNLFERERELNDNDKNVRVFEPNTDNDGGLTVNGRRYIKPIEEKGPPSGGPPKSGICETENKAFDAHIRKNLEGSDLSSVDKMLSFTAHEAFHSVDQNAENVIHSHTGACEWVSNKMARSLPGDISELKFARQHLIKSLMDAYKASKGSEERSSAMRQVRAWSDWIAMKFPNESKLFEEVDRTEGMAEFVGIMTNVYGKLGCTSSEGQKRSLIISHLKSRYIPTIQDPDQQGYLIGAISGLLLDEESKEGNWKESVARDSITPLEILKEKEIYKNASKVTPMKDKVLMASVEVESKLKACQNSEVKKVLDPIVHGDEEYVMIQLDPVTFSSRGFFTYISDDKQEITVSLGSSSSGPTVKMENLPIIRIEGLCPLGGSPNYIAVPKRLVNDEGNIEPQDDFKVSTRVDLTGSPVTWKTHSVDCR